MATLASSVTSDTTGTGQSHTGDCTVYVYGTFDDAFVDIQISPDDTNWVNIQDSDGKNEGRFRKGGAITVSAKGTYYLRANVANSGSSTSVSAETTQ